MLISDWSSYVCSSDLLCKQDALKVWIVEETLPGSRIETDEDILANAVQLGGTSFHICGTCRMGPDATSVVDPSLRVRGVDGLRVVDTSIMPTIVSGNTNAPAMRSEEHTSELQSLMRISYAVFCLK